MKFFSDFDIFSVINWCIKFFLGTKLKSALKKLVHPIYGTETGRRVLSYSHFHLSLGKWFQNLMCLYKIIKHIVLPCGAEESAWELFPSHDITSYSLSCCAHR